MNERSKVLIIKEIVEKEFGFALWDETGLHGKREKGNAKKIYSGLSRMFTGASVAVIGNIINRDHSDIVYLAKKCEEHCGLEADFKLRYLKCLDEIPQKIQREARISQDANYKRFYEHHKKEAKKWYRLLKRQQQALSN